VHARPDAGAAASVRRVFARVDLQSTALAELKRLGAGWLHGVLVTSGTPESLSVYVRLSAEDSEGRRIASEGFDFGMSGPRHGIWHRRHGPPLPDDYEEAARIMLFEHRADVRDVEDGINQMLGRDPTLHHPPRLSWGKLIEALGEAGVPVRERDLTEAPLTIELAPDLQAELDRV
jgi:hypothetical protein